MPVRNAGNAPAVLVPGAAHQPPVCKLPGGKRCAAGCNELFHGVHCGKINLPLGADIGKKVHMRVGKRGGYGTSAKVNHLCCRRNCGANLRLRADGNDSAIHGGERGNEGGCRIQRVDASVYVKFLHKSYPFQVRVCR